MSSGVLLSTIRVIRMIEARDVCVEPGKLLTFLAPGVERFVAQLLLSFRDPVCRFGSAKGCGKLGELRDEFEDDLRERRDGVRIGGADVVGVISRPELIQMLDRDPRSLSDVPSIDIGPQSGRSVLIVLRGNF